MAQWHEDGSRLGWVERVFTVTEDQGELAENISKKYFREDAPPP
jgi:hypothetical protein